MTNGNDRPIKALEAARDVVKQLVTIDAALLAFGVSFVQNITKSQGPTGWIDLATILLLVSLACGLATLFRIVAETHPQSGDINDKVLRFALIASMLTFAGATVCIAIYILKAPTPLPDLSK